MQAPGVTSSSDKFVDVRTKQPPADTLGNLRIVFKTLDRLNEAMLI